MIRFIVFYFLMFYSTYIIAQPTPIGHWDFNDPNNLTHAQIGSELQLFGNHLSVLGPNDTDGAIKIDVGSYYKATHGITANGGGSKVNNYSIVMDVKIPFSGYWYALYQTDITNENDGDWFINPSGNIGIGEVGYTTSFIFPEQWYRIAISVSNGNRYDYYIDGEKKLEGNYSSIDGRFSLDKDVLFFADENKEDNSFSVSDIKIYSRDLTNDEIKSLGGYTHKTPTINTYPYLQSPTSTSIYVCWTFKGNNPAVEYGINESLGSQTIPETIKFADDPNFTWYTAKLENLTPNTKYFYKVSTDSVESEIYSFQTQPENDDSSEHIRFVVYADNQTYYNKFSEVNDSVLSKVKSLYGNNIEDHINLVFDAGDIVTNGNNLNQFIPEFFNPSHSISTSVPYMISIGNHEQDSPNFFNFMKYENFGGPQGEKYYSFRIGRVLFISLNSNTQYRNDTQINWLNRILTNAEIDETIEWIFAFNHHPGHSEMWPHGNTDYVQNKIIPTLANYSKVDMLSYGHSHNNERGTAINGDFRLLCIGGAGGNLDRWGEYDNQRNYPEIQKAFDHHCYAIVDIDIENKFCEVNTYSIGNQDNPLANIKIDHFIRDKKNQAPPSKPTLLSPQENTIVQFPFKINSSEYDAKFEIMSSHIQFSKVQNDFDNPILEVKRDFEDIYGIPQPPEYKPINLNLGIDLTEYVVTKIDGDGKYWCRIRYRDKNLQWSNWSNVQSFTVNSVTDIDSENIINAYKLFNNYPNPFNPTTTIQFDLHETSFVNLSIHNSLGELVKELENSKMESGHYAKTFDASNLSSGIYYYRLKANNFIKVKKMTLLK